MVPLEEISPQEYVINMINMKYKLSLQWQCDRKAEPAPVRKKGSEVKDDL